MSDEYYEGDDAPAPQAPSPLRKRAGAVVAGAAIAAVERAESMKDRLDRRVDKMNKWASQNIVRSQLISKKLQKAPSAHTPLSPFFLSLLQVGRYFMFKERRAKLSTEMRAGVITFLMVAYVLAVNPQILGVTGGTCDPATLCDPDVYKLRGNACLFDTDNTAATDCLSTLRMSLTTATAASSLISCFIMGFFANLPLALAPGMGINIYVAYQVVSQGLLTYEQALTAIFLEGWIFIALSMTGIRGGLIRMMPQNIAFASSVGIGLLLAFSGLRNLGVIVFDSNTLLTVGGCPPKNRRYAFTPDIAAVDPANLTDALNASLSSAASIAESSAAVYSCVGGEMRSATMWLGFAGGLIMAYLLIAGIPGSLFIGIAFVTVISWIPGHSASYLGEGSSIPGGAARMEVFEQVVAAPSLEGIGLAWDWSACGSGHFWVALLTFLYIDLLDCTGTLLSMATLMDDCMRRDADDEGKLEVYERKFLKSF
jgi:AGZA family xanthine/uracil permease-like MFS transporter